MEIKIKKTSIIAFIICVILCFASFLYGKYTRFNRISGTSQQLIDGIILTRDEADRVLDELSIARSAGNSATDYGYAISEGIRKLRSSNEEQRVFINAIIAEVDFTTKNAEIINESFTGVSDAIDYGWQLAIEESKGFERIASCTRSFNEHTSEDE